MDQSIKSLDDINNPIQLRNNNKARHIITHVMQAFISIKNFHFFS